MNDDELRDLVLDVERMTASSAWERIYSRPAAEWEGGANWEFKSDHEAQFDAFLQLAFSDLPSWPSADYVESLVSNYTLAIVSAPDAANKAIRAFEAYYRRLLDSIAHSIRRDVAALADSPDSDVEVAEVFAELDRFTGSIVYPRFVPGGTDTQS